MAAQAIVAPAASVASSDDDLALETRIAAIGYRLARGAAGRCALPENMAGMIVHDIGGYSQSDRPAIAKSLGLGMGFGIRAIVVGGAADRAGLRAGDEITGLGGRDLAGFARDAIGGRASFDRTERFTDLLADALRGGPVPVAIRRGGRVRTIVLGGDPGCAARFAVAVEARANARADGRYVAVTSALATLAPRDDALAFAMAHEMAHILLDHVGQRRGGRRDRATIRAQELAADRLAVAIMADAGYPLEGAIVLLDLLARGGGGGGDPDHPSLRDRRDLLRAAIAAERAPARP